MDYRIGRLNRFITGWVAYFRLAQRVSVLGKLDGWLRRRVRIRSWSFSRLIAFGATQILTCEPDRRNPKPSSVACAACRIEDFSRFTFSFSRRPVTPQTLSNTL